jgi:aldose 1-epimerase
VGRYANRIALGRFTLDGAEYTLARNNGPNALHGGPTGFANRLWTGRVEGDRVVFSYLSADGEEGYPGELGVEAVYDWDDDCNLEITYFARGNAPTVVNLTNHVYFNLAGGDSGGVLGHTLKLHASHWLPTDQTQIPTGEITPVAGTPMDFTVAKKIGRDIDADFQALKIGHGYDHCWMVDGYKQCGELDSRLKDVAVLRDPASGRTLAVRSTQPAVQVYTGNWLSGCPKSKSGHDYENRDGVAIECQGCPDAPNKPMFPSQRLAAGELYNEKIVFSFTNS